MSEATPLPSGDYCIVELFGHQTLVGRYREVEKFGTLMLAIEPLYRDELLPPVYHGGASIYRMTPCEPEVARRHQPRHGHQLPPAVRAIVPDLLLTTDELEKTYGLEDQEEMVPF